MKALLFNISLALLLPFVLQAQIAPAVSVRFARPAYDPAMHLYTVDIELAGVEVLEIFNGMNLRFFYDARRLTYNGIDQFAPGHGFGHTPPVALVGNDTSGVILFGMEGAAGYINGSIDVLDPSLPLVLTPGEWTRLCRVRFDVDPVWWDSDEFCPAIVWDQRFYAAQQGFLPGSEGLVIAVVTREGPPMQNTSVCLVNAEPFNWQYNNGTDLPAGAPENIVCISLARIIAVDEPATMADGYILYQNHPNPFAGQTAVAFFLPRGQHIRLEIYTITGELIDNHQGHYPAGQSEIILFDQPGMQHAGVFVYRLVTEDGTILARRMNRVEN